MQVLIINNQAILKNNVRKTEVLIKYIDFLHFILYFFHSNLKNNSSYILFLGSLSTI
jgi:hypothetical protein